MSVAVLLKRASELNLRLARGPHDSFWNAKILDANKDIEKLSTALRKATFKQDGPEIFASVTRIRRLCDTIESLIPR